MLARILERSLQVIELFRELRRVARAERPIVFSAPPRIAIRPEPLHVCDVRLGG